MSRKYSTLVVSQSEKTVKVLTGLLASCGLPTVRFAGNAGTARRIASDMRLDFVIINTPLPDDYGIQLAQDMADNNLGVMLIVKNDSFEHVAYKLEEYGVVTLPKPVSKEAFMQAMRLLRVMKLKIEKMEAKAQTLESKMKEIRLVNRAKWILIDRMNMSEAEAHKYIEKSSMDECVGRGIIAEKIIKTYES